MCKAWVTRAADAAQRSLGTYERPPECLMSTVVAKARVLEVGRGSGYRNPENVFSDRVFTDKMVCKPRKCFFAPTPKCQKRQVSALGRRPVHVELFWASVPQSLDVRRQHRSIKSRRVGG
eukprot:3630611-Prymnesium_polylepis.1